VKVVARCAFRDHTKRRRLKWPEATFIGPTPWPSTPDMDQTHDHDVLLPDAYTRIE